MHESGSGACETASKPRKSKHSGDMNNHQARPENKVRTRDILMGGFGRRKDKPGKFSASAQKVGPNLSSNDTIAAQIHNPLPAPLSVPFDNEGRHIGPSYTYDKVLGGLKRQPTDAQRSSQRDFSNGSTQVHTGMEFYEERDTAVDGDEDNESQLDTNPPYVSLARRPVSMNPVVPPNDVSTQAKPPSEAERLRQLLHIERNILGPLKNHPESSEPEDRTAEKALRWVLDDYERLWKSSVESHSQAASPFPNRAAIIQQHDQLREANTSLDHENRELKENCKNLKASESRLQDKILKMTGDYRALEETMSREAKAYNSLIAELRYEKSQLETSHSAKTRKDYNAKQSELEALKRMYEDTLRKMREEASSKQRDALRRQEGDSAYIEQLNRKFADADREWRARYSAWEETRSDLEHRLKGAKSEEEARVRETNEKWERKAQIAQKNQEDYVSNLQSEITRLNKIIDSERSVKDDELRSQEKKLKEKHERETVKLHTVIEDFKVASSKREHFKGLTDSEVAAQYKRLANSIEDVSRLEWDFLKEGQWPLTDSRMRELSKNTRKLKQQIVQHVIWMCLFDYIFCSPFRIMGEDGRELDANFVGIYSSGASSYDWPDVPADVESTRFEAAKAFLNAIDPSAGDSAAKKSIEGSIVVAMDAICRALVQVATVHAKDRRGLEAIVRSAAKVWLESCSQRYRLVVVLPEARSKILTSAFVDDGSLSLVVRPDVKRYGDSHGKDLMRGEPLAGWKGSTENYVQ